MNSTTYQTVECIAIALVIVFSACIGFLTGRIYGAKYCHSHSSCECQECQRVFDEGWNGGAKEATCKWEEWK